MTETTTVTIEVEVPVVPEDEKRELGHYMLSCGLSEWFGYDDEGEFVSERHGDGYKIFDPAAMDKPKIISFEEFFEAHFNLIWLRQITNYRHDWIQHAFREGNDMDTYDNYDALSCEAVLQNLLYGEIIYG